jgi:PKD repeat protein
MPLAVRRLERRRVLDASITSFTPLPGAMIPEGPMMATAEATGFGTLFFEWSLTQDGVEIAALNQTSTSGQAVNASFTLPDDSGDHEYALLLEVTDSAQSTDSEMRILDVANVDPVIDSLVASDVLEGGTTTLNGTYSDAGILDTHVLDVDWNGDGTFDELGIAISGGTFSVMHQFADDDPTGTPSDTFLIGVRIRDDDGGEGVADAEITVSNIAPVIESASATNIFESGATTLSGTYSDAGALDTHLLDIDWDGDGTYDELGVSVGGGSFSVSHSYLDDPADPLPDTFFINIRLRDDDGGEDTASTEITVTNFSPVFEGVDAIDVNENGVTTLSGAYFDLGPLDTHTLDIDWDGDGVFDELNVAVSGGSFSIDHQYLDDPADPLPDTFAIIVRIRDDDGGQDLGFAQITVSNLDPVLEGVAATDVAENGTTTLSGTYSDIGTLDTHFLDIDWDGDGTFDELAVPISGGAFSINHQYLDDNPTGTPSDTFLIGVRLRDDDGGSDVGSAEITVTNVVPVLTPVGNQTISEGQLLDLTGAGGAPLLGTFTDVGTLDTHTATIDWGDGSATEAAAVTQLSGGGSLAGSHSYADDGVYTVTITLTDDDGGAHVQMLDVLVENVAPTLTVIGSQTIDEGSPLSLPNIGMLTDPGFANLANPNGPSVETFSYLIDWGDGTAADTGTATIDQLGTVGLPTAASLDGSHTFADNGTYLVTIRVADDDMSGNFASGMAGVDYVEQTFSVIVENVIPTLTVVGEQSIDEGSPLSLVNVGSLTDPGFANPANPAGASVESFAFFIDWGDGTAAATGSATIDQPGMVGLSTAASFDGSHTFADNGTYTVTIRVSDDDMSGNFAGGTAGVDFVQQSFTVVVSNVNPILTGLDAPKIINEGQSFVLSNLGGSEPMNLGIGLSDPGFDNPLNAGNVSNGGETAETFTGVSIDWGDGSPTSLVTIVNRVSGSPGVLTTAQFEHLAHTYADNGVYTVSVTFSDDDGGPVTRTFTIEVLNVAPTLTLTNQVFVINEGTTLTLPNLGVFTDPGFNNPINPNVAGGSTETFHYTIDWGDGTEPQIEQLPATTVNGAPGVLTSGTLAHTHFYADNDSDNIYTITVALSDDDGGSHVQSFDITVHNVNPTLLPVSATDVETTGRTTLDLSFFDPGADSFQVLVDWGDKLGLPEAERFVVETVHTGPTPMSFTLVHFYTGPPDPLHPTADITITVKVFDDDALVAGVVAPGISNLESATISNPGINTTVVAIDTTPDVPRLEFTPPAAPDVFIPTALPSTQTQQTITPRIGSAEAVVAAERFLRLCVIRPDGQPLKCFRIKDEALYDLRGFFATLPDNRYRVYVVRTETSSERQVIEVDVRRGQLIDLFDASEGTRDRPPTSETLPGRPGPNVVPLEENPLLEQMPNVRQPDPTQPTPTPAAAPDRSAASKAPDHVELTAGAAALAASIGWSRRVDAALAKADDRHWKRLRRAGRLGSIFSHRSLSNK